MIIQLGVKECLLTETAESKRNRTGKSGKSKAEDQDSEKPVKAKDESDVLKLLAMIERCGVVVTEVPSSE